MSDTESSHKLTYAELLPFCETDVQRKVISMLSEGKSYRAISKELHRSGGSISGCVGRVRDKAAIKGVAPEFDMNHQVPSPYIVNGTSTYYNEDGKPVGQWVKTKLDTARFMLMQEALAEEFAKTLPRYRAKEVSRRKGEKREKLLAVIPLADAHIGLRSWKPETGNDYDLEIAERDICNAVTSLIDSAPVCEECLIFGLGDWQHFDNAVGVTERSGNVLDTDGRYAKMLGVAIRVIRHTIEYAAEKFPKVVVAHCKGNHDDLGALWLSAALKNVYEDEKRIEVLDNVSPRIYYRWNGVLLMGTHGSDAKTKELPLIMASERRKDWGETKHHMVLCGHIHHQSVLEVADTVVESFDALCAKDAWSNERGFLSKRTVKMLVFHPDKGEVLRMTHSIE